MSKKYNLYMKYLISLYFAASIFSFLGLLVEVIFSGILDLFKKGILHMRGDVHLAMAPVYFISYFFLTYLVDSIGWNDIAWMQIYFVVFVVYVAEYFFGLLYERIGIKAWHYDHVIMGWRFDLHNKITLAYFPFWCVFAFLVIQYHKYWPKIITALELVF